MVEDDTEFDLEDISIIFEVLDEQLELGEVVVGMVEEVSTTESEGLKENKPQFVCKYCGKITKSKGGLTRHMCCMHEEYHYDNYYSSKLDSGSLHSLVKKSITELEKDLCYPKEIRENFKNYNNQ